MTPERIKDLMSSNSECIFLTLIDIMHEDLVESLHFSNNMHEDIIFEGITYKAAAFTFDPPDMKAGDAGSAKVNICVVDQQIPSILLALATPPRLLAHHIVNTVTNAVEELEEWEFTLYNTTWDNFALTGDLVYETFLETAIPADSYDITNFPGCY